MFQNMRLSKKFLVLALLPASLLSGGMAAGRSEDRDAEAAIRAAAKAYSAAYTANDVDALAALYAADAVLVPPGDDLVEGRDAIREYFRWPDDHREIAHALRTESVDVRGDMAIEIGEWETTYQRRGGERATQRAPYLMVWAREGDAWRVAYDTWHHLPPPPPLPPVPPVPAIAPVPPVPAVPPLHAMAPGAPRPPAPPRAPRPPRPPSSRWF
jgi:uncharacterized protein (TIGR02246 family)